MLFWIIFFCLLGGAGGVVAAARVLVLPEERRRSLLPLLLSYASGTLLGTAFLGLLPESLERVAPMTISMTILAGIVLFFLLEKLVIWHHCHAEICEVHGQAGPLILIGDALHNFVDGFVIAAAFLTSFPLGVATSLAVFAHEIPQEVGDFAILLDSGYSTRKAFLYNLLSALAILPGAVIAYAYLETMQAAVPYVLALAAASFMYIAMADLLPNQHRYAPLAATRRQLLLMLAGIGTIAIFNLLGLG
jgi:zinc and cadmium transporter